MRPHGDCGDEQQTYCTYTMTRRCSKLRWEHGIHDIQCTINGQAILQPTCYITQQRI
jgi:hypothetical protein